ncbi:hypothetical protein [Acidipropionibacterium jensenii]|uniref:hypothetical protein n=1 Tax=Acidipropionibacterium jensenii TaxID=1749 RepID=UPI001C2FB2E4|nr:hypothetical protein [Acidipropionibacterium jensenii]
MLHQKVVTGTLDIRRCGVCPFGVSGVLWCAGAGVVADEGGEGFGQVRAEVFVVGDLQAFVEGLAREASVGVVGVGVHAVGVGEQAEGVVEECAASRVLLGVGGEALVDVGESGADTILVALQCW